MAEIEHFYDPEIKTHPKLDQVAHMELPFYSAADQDAGKKMATMIKVNDALEQNILKNETVAYFLARTFQFLTQVGI